MRSSASSPIAVLDVARLTKQRGDLVADHLEQPLQLRLGALLDGPRLLADGIQQHEHGARRVLAEPDALDRGQPHLLVARRRGRSGSATAAPPTKSIVRAAPSASSTTGRRRVAERLAHEIEAARGQHLRHPPHHRRPHLGRFVLEQPLEGPQHLVGQHAADRLRRLARRRTDSPASSPARRTQERAQRRAREDRAIGLLGDQPGEHRDRLTVEFPLDQIVAPDVQVGSRPPQMRGKRGRGHARDSAPPRSAAPAFGSAGAGERRSAAAPRARRRSARPAARSPSDVAASIAACSALTDSSTGPFADWFARAVSIHSWAARSR